MLDDKEKNFMPKSAGKLGELFKTLLSIVSNRLSLASVECQEYAGGMLFGMVWLVVGLLALQIMVLVLLILIAIITPADWRITVFSILALVFFGIFMGAILTFRRHLAHLTSPLASTLAEIKKDLETLVRGH